MWEVKTKELLLLPSVQEAILLSLIMLRKFQGSPLMFYMLRSDIVNQGKILLLSRF